MTLKFNFLRLYSFFSDCSGFTQALRGNPALKDDLSLPPLALDTRFPAGMTGLVHNDEHGTWERGNPHCPLFAKGKNCSPDGACGVRV